MSSQNPFNAVTDHLANTIRHLNRCSISSQGDIEDESRKKMLAEARKLVASLEKPAEVVMRVVMEVSASS